MKMGCYLWMMKMQYHFGSFTMARLTLQQRRFVIESMLKVSSYKQCAADFRKKFNTTISKNGIAKIMAKWNQLSVLEDQHRGKSGRPKRRSAENIAAVSEIIGEAEGHKSVRKIASMSGMSYGVTLNIIRRDLKLKPYKPTVSQKLSSDQIEKRFQFCKRMQDAFQDEEIDIEKIIFTDESHIYLDDAPNKQNNRNWQLNKPDFNFQRPLHSKKVTVWVGMTANRIFGPYFFEDPVTGNMQTVNAERYVEMLETVFDEEMMSEVADHWYQQDGAPSHTSRISMACLEEKFSAKLISGKSEFPWPACSPDLNPLDYFLWGHVKSIVFEVNPRTTEDLKAAVEEAIGSIPSEMLQRTVANFTQRLELCCAAKGGHFETK